MGELYRNPSTSSLRASTSGELIFYKDNDKNAERNFDTMRAFREQQNLDLIDILVLDGQIEWHKNFSMSKFGFND